MYEVIELGNSFASLFFAADEKQRFLEKILGGRYGRLDQQTKVELVETRFGGKKVEERVQGRETICRGKRCQACKRFFVISC